MVLNNVYHNISYLPKIELDENLKPFISIQELSTPYEKKIADEINKKSLIIDTKDSQKSFFNLLRTHYSKFFFQETEDTIKKIKEKLKEIKVNIKLAKPEEHFFCRRIEEIDSTSPNIFVRNSIFLVLKTNDRAALTYEKDGKDEDKFIAREITRAGSDYKISLKGPVLCQKDQLVFFSLIKLWHINNSNGDMISTSLNEIYRAMGNNGNPGNNNRNSLLRSLTRLSEVTIRTSHESKRTMWSGHIMSFEHDDSKRGSKVSISFNKHFLKHYLFGDFSTFNFELYKELSTYPKKLYTFLTSHKPSEFHASNKISLEKLKIILGAPENLEMKHFKYNIKKSIEEMKDKNIFLDGTKINEKNQLEFKISPNHYLREVYKTKKS